MDRRLESKLREVVYQESQAVIRCLIGAERAVEQGRFNIAKVLRAAAYTARIRAMNLQRLLAPQEPSPAVIVEAERGRRYSQHEALEAALTLARQGKDEAFTSRLQRIHEAANSLVDILDRSVESLRRHPTIMESDVAPILFGCQECGYIAQMTCPDVCPHCGALGAEFQWFGPFYSATDEHLGRRRAEEITAILQKSPVVLENAFEGVSDEVLRRRPTPTRWCMKEIAGHMVDVTELFLERVRVVLESERHQSLSEPIPPWRILEGKGYPDIAAREIVARFLRATEEALSRIQTLKDNDWTQQVLHRGKPCNILDLGTWLANHNVGHLKQVEALREQFTQ